MPYIYAEGNLRVYVDTSIEFDHKKHTLKLLKYTTEGLFAQRTLKQKKIYRLEVGNDPHYKINEDSHGDYSFVPTIFQIMFDEGTANGFSSH